MKELSEKEKQYQKLRHTVTILGNLLTIALPVFMIYTALAVAVFRTSYLYFAIGFPIVFCFLATVIALLCVYAKKERAAKIEIYGTAELTTDNPIFSEIIDDYYHDQLEGLEHLLPKKWKLFDVDDYDNKIIICIKNKHGMQIEIEISENDIVITGEQQTTEEEIIITKNLTVDNFPDLSSVLLYLAEICEKLN